MTKPHDCYHLTKPSSYWTAHRHGGLLMKPKVSLQTLLKRHGACSEALEWCEQFSTPAEAWDACRKPEWLFWAIDRLDLFDAKKARLFACWSVRQVWHLLTDE